MKSPPTVLLLGGTGRTGRRVLEQLLARGVKVRAIVRSPRKLPPGTEKAAGLTVVEGDLVRLRDEDLAGHLQGCDAVVSCLGHVISLKGIFGRPHDLVAGSVRRCCAAIEALAPAEPVRVIVMTSVSVNHPGGLDARRGRLDRVLLWVLRALVPPVKDNQRAADFLCGVVGRASPFVQWVVVRPDSLLEGDVSEYAVHEGLVTGLFAPDSTRMANVAHFMCELITSPSAWERWQGKVPVVIDGPSRRQPTDALRA